MVGNIIRVCGFKKMASARFPGWNTYHLDASLACPDDLDQDQVGNMEKLVIGFRQFFSFNQQWIIAIDPFKINLRMPQCYFFGLKYSSVSMV